MTAQPSVSLDAQLLVGQARKDVSDRANVTIAQVNPVSVASVSWPDSSLGCPQPGMMYSMIVTPGYRIILQASGVIYEYHTDRGQRVVLCSKK